MKVDKKLIELAVINMNRKNHIPIERIELIPIYLFIGDIDSYN